MILSKGDIRSRNRDSTKRPVLAITNDTHDLPPRPTFVEPYPERLHGLLRPEDHDSVTIIERPLQDVDPTLFDVLDPGDVLFVDSSHVSKVGSDVNLLLFDVLPRVPAGV